MKLKWISLVLVGLTVLTSCQTSLPTPTTLPTSAVADLPVVLATETFIGDIAQNVAGSRLEIQTLLPVGLDPHSFELTPADITKISKSDVILVNGGGLETWLEETLTNAGGNYQVIDASTGMESRTAQPGELITPGAQGEVIDPHFWLDPTKVITYVENIRDGLIQADPAGKEIYTSNAEAYITQLQALDQWVTEQVSQIPTDRRLLVTNHESLGYYADRYGFKIVGAILPSVTTDGSPSAQQLADLVDQIKASQAIAIFLEVGANTQLADMISNETGIKVVTDLYTETLSDSSGDAPTYLDMIRYDTTKIVDALK
jgi:ABC-type Zn uptake system ZnuABC Zn-binding protein ZnuA